MGTKKGVMSVEECEEMFVSCSIDIGGMKNEINSINLKKEISSIDFLKIIMKVEQIYDEELPNCIIEADYVSFDIIGEYFVYGKI